MTGVANSERQYVIQGNKALEAARIENATGRMCENKAYRYAVDAGTAPLDVLPQNPRGAGIAGARAA